MDRLQYLADRAKAYLGWFQVVLAQPYERNKDSNLCYMKIMESCRVNSRVLKDCRLSSVPWSISKN